MKQNETKQPQSVRARPSHQGNILWLSNENHAFKSNKGDIKRKIRHKFVMICISYFTSHYPLTGCGFPNKLSQSTRANPSSEFFFLKFPIKSVFRKIKKLNALMHHSSRKKKKE